MQSAQSEVMRLAARLGVSECEMIEWGEDAMKAGRELDALVAEKVLGLSVSKMATSEYSYGFFYNPARAENTWQRLPHYSTNLTAAWQVVEKMAEKGWRVCFSDNGNTHAERWDCRFFREPGTSSKDRVIAICDTAPLAICLAALRACGVEVGDEGE
jgi:hypothetical protein